MAEEKEKPRGFVLGEKATIFADPTSDFVVTSHKEPVEATKVTKRMAEALKAGAIVEVKDYTPPKKAKEKTEDLSPEEKAKQEKEALVKKLTDMTPEDRLKYYKEKFDVDKKDEEAFIAMKPKAQVKFLTEE